jgi:putative solute:sodium symporter small subunit
LVDWLNNYQLFGSGYPLGFWFAQQGSIYAFVILIFYYVKKVNQLDKEFEVDE